MDWAFVPRAYMQQRVRWGLVQAGVCIGGGGGGVHLLFWVISFSFTTPPRRYTGQYSAMARHGFAAPACNTLIYWDDCVAATLILFKFGVQPQVHVLIISPHLTIYFISSPHLHLILLLL